MQPSLDLMVAWARGAGDILRDGYGKQHQINRKGRIDLVTEVDQRSEDYLLDLIRTHFPDDSIDAEESGLSTGTGAARWYIDPLDGTTNYAHGIPVFSVSLAYALHGSVQLGVVYDPMRDECFTAERGQGARLNGSPVAVSEINEFTHSLLVTGFPYEVGPNGNDNLEHFAHFTRRCQGVRRMGSAALDLCYVAAGRFDGYWELTLRPWDMAAGALLVEEAGGRVSRITGEAEYLLPPYSVLAGNPAIYEQMLREMRTLA
jgi:myo-inositol-1(or 4)-monophosphatase